MREVCVGSLCAGVQAVFVWRVGASVAVAAIPSYISGSRRVKPSASFVVCHGAWSQGVVTE